MDISVLEQVVRAGLVTRTGAASVGVSDRLLARWVRHGLIARVARGVYSVGQLSRPMHDPAAIAASWRVVISHWSAAAWWGVDMPRVVALVHVTAPRNRNRRQVAGICMHRADLRPGDVLRLHDALVTSPLRTALDLARSATVEEAVTIIDAFLRKRVLRIDELRAAAAAMSGRGSAQVRLVVSLVDPQSGSVFESLTRVLLWRHDLLPPASQWLIRHGLWWGYVDFAWPEQRVVLECDGYEFHSAYDVFVSDRRRWSTLNRAGWRVGVVTWADVMNDPTYVVGLVRELLEGAETKQHTMTGEREPDAA